MSFLMDIVSHLPADTQASVMSTMVKLMQRPRTVALAALPAAALLAFVPHFVKGVIIVRTTGSYDNVHPRQQLKKIARRLSHGSGGASSGSGCSSSGSSSRSSSGCGSGIGAVDPAVQRTRLLCERLVAAHQNGMEAFVLFAAAVLACCVSKANGVATARRALVFLCARTAYNVAYACGTTRAVAFVRTMCWTFGHAQVFQLFKLAVDAELNPKPRAK